MIRVPLVRLLAPLALAATPLVAQAPPAIGLDTAGMDRSVKPGDDFFEYANGTWLKRTEIPADRSTYGAGAIADRADRPAHVADLIQEAAKGDAAGRLRPAQDRRLLRQLHGHDGDRGGRPHAAPAHARLDRRHPRPEATSPALLGSTLRADVDALNNTNFYTENLFGLWVAQDLDDPTHYSPFLLQGGLGMPDRSYYVDSSSAMATIREQVPAARRRDARARQGRRRRREGRRDRAARDQDRDGALEPRGDRAT